VTQLCEGLSALHHQVTVLSRDLADVPPSWSVGRGLGPVAYRLRLPNRTALGDGTGPTLRALVAGNDVVHIHSLWAPGSLFVAFAAARADVPYVLSPRGSLSEWPLKQKEAKKRLFLKVFGRKYIGRAHTLHCTAKSEWDQVQRVIGNRRKVILPNLIELSELPTSAKSAGGSVPTILFLSRLHPQKGVEHLLTAAAQLLGRGFRLRVIVAGAGERTYVRSLRSLAGRLGIAQSVEFIGAVWGEQRAALYQAADIFALPTSSESFGRVLFEALACGTVVVTTVGVATADELRESGGAVIVNQNAREFAEAIERLLRDGALREEMARKGSAWVHGRLDRTVLAEAYAQEYAAIIVSHGLS
jgi:glycosyltransferase involved in cell wall biosynthesis